MSKQITDSDIVFTYEDDDGNELEGKLPAKLEVCDGCRGNGKHVNRNIDGHGITQEEFAEDPEFEEAYFRGDYDVTCEDCDGSRVQKVVDEERADKELLKIYYAQLESERYSNYEDAYIRRMESGGY